MQSQREMIKNATGGIQPLLENELAEVERLIEARQQYPFVFDLSLKQIAQFLDHQKRERDVLYPLNKEMHNLLSDGELQRLQDHEEKLRKDNEQKEKASRDKQRDFEFEFEMLVERFADRPDFLLERLEERFAQGGRLAELLERLGERFADQPDLLRAFT